MTPPGVQPSLADTICTQVLDKTGLDKNSSAAIHLCPNASGVLRQWGIYGETFGACLMSRFHQRTSDGATFRDLDLVQSNAQWLHPWHLVYRGALHQELKRAATTEDRPGTPVILLLGRRVVQVDPQLGVVTLEDGSTLSADVVLGADGIAVGLLSLSRPSLIC